MDLLAKRADVKSLAQEAVRRVGRFPFAQVNGRIIRFAGRFIDEGLARELLAVDFDGTGSRMMSPRPSAGWAPFPSPSAPPFREERSGRNPPGAECPGGPSDGGVGRSHPGPLAPVMGRVQGMASGRRGRHRGQKVHSLPQDRTEREESKPRAKLRLLFLINGAVDPLLERIKRELSFGKKERSACRGRWRRGTWAPS